MMLGGIALFLYPQIGLSQEFHLDYDRIGNADQMRGGDFILEGDIAPQQMYGSAGDVQVYSAAIASIDPVVEENADSSDNAQSAQNIQSEPTNASVTGGGGGGKRNTAAEHVQNPRETSEQSPVPDASLDVIVTRRARLNPVKIAEQNAEYAVPEPRRALAANRGVPRQSLLSINNGSFDASGIKSSGKVLVSAQSAEKNIFMKSMKNTIVMMSAIAILAGVIMQFLWMTRFKNGRPSFSTTLSS